MRIALLSSGTILLSCLIAACSKQDDSSRKTSVEAKAPSRKSEGPLIDKAWAILDRASNSSTEWQELCKGATPAQLIRLAEICGQPKLDDGRKKLRTLVIQHMIRGGHIVDLISKYIEPEKPSMILIMSFAEWIQIAPADALQFWREDVPATRQANCRNALCEGISWMPAGKLMELQKHFKEDEIPVFAAETAKIVTTRKDTLGFLGVLHKSPPDNAFATRLVVETLASASSTQPDKIASWIRENGSHPAITDDIVMHVAQSAFKSNPQACLEWLTALNPLHKQPLEALLPELLRAWFEKQPDKANKWSTFALEKEYSDQVAAVMAGIALDKSDMEIARQWMDQIKNDRIKLPLVPRTGATEKPSR